MGLDIARAFREGASRTAGRNGLLLAAAFAAAALLTTVLFQSLLVAALESAFEALQSASPEELGFAEAEYDDALDEFETALTEVRAATPLSLGVSASVAAAGLLATVIASEALSIAAVRTFAADAAETVTRERLTGNILLATLNGFVGAIVVWGLIVLGSVLFLLPGVAVAILFFFMRQEIALNDKNFVQAMADSWRTTKGHRIRVFLVGAALVIVSRLEEASSAAVGIVSTPAGTVVASVVGGLLAAFGAAVATRAYVQIDGDDAVEPEPDEKPDEEPEDPYDAALGPDDLSR